MASGGPAPAPPPPLLYLVADRGAFRNDDAWLQSLRRLDTVLAGLAPADDLAVQLRVKKPLTRGDDHRTTLLSRGLDVLGSARPAGVSVFVNGTTAEAVRLDADGVHWPETLVPAAPSLSHGLSVPPGFAGSAGRSASAASVDRSGSSGSAGRAASGRDGLRRGASIHSEEALERALRAGADFVVYGPVFDPGSKPGSGRGLDALAAIAGSSALPVVAIGGITAARARACLEAGAAGVAVVSAVFGSAAVPEERDSTGPSEGPDPGDAHDRPDPGSAVAALLRELR